MSSKLLQPSGSRSSSRLAVLLVCLVTTMLSSTHGFTVPPRLLTTTPTRQRSTIPPVSHPVNNQRLLSSEYTAASSCTALSGIPKMFRWLTDQYPDVLHRQLEQGISDDLTVDNFYLDMNGIIHPCTHGNAEGEIIILDETAMFKKIFLYVDRYVLKFGALQTTTRYHSSVVVSHSLTPLTYFCSLHSSLYKLVQPTKLLYLAVDGVAPRAKMNQQRSRRFRSAKDAEIMAMELEARGQIPPDQKRFDSNCITPGTDFMLKLSLAIQKWVDYKMQTDPFWKDGADVIVSGPDVPGEGEHKVMDFIRLAKEKDQNPRHYQPGYTHVLYGLDADLIMLGLVTHEPNFLLLREKMSVVMAGRGRNKYRKKKDMLDYNENDFEILELTGLRQMLAIQFQKFNSDASFQSKFELERIIDDFVFMCMLVGNDFLPHAPHLEIDSGALSLMMTNYIDLLPEWGGYLTHRDKLHPQRFEQFMYHLSIYEEEHFKRRAYEENEPGWKLSASESDEDDPDDFYGTCYSGNPTPPCAVGANQKGQPEPAEEDRPMAPTGNRAFRRKHEDSLSRSYRDFYYETKMGWKPQDRSRTLFRRRAHVRDYMEGLHWVMNYYHNGCMSWDYFFPHLYSPLATDMVNLAEFYSGTPDEDGFCAFDFEMGTPFPSLAQLLSVLPPQSAELLPKPLAELMLHPSSPLAEYYPPDFTSDPNGKRQSWEAIVQIPFIDSGILLGTVDQIINADTDGSELLTNAERRRNLLGKDHLFIPPGLDEAEREEMEKRAKMKTVKGRMPTRERAPAGTRTRPVSKRQAPSNQQRKPRPQN
jgi:5'-3' exoribonuclease 1